MTRAKKSLPWKDQAEGAMYATMIEAARVAQGFPTAHERGTTVIALLGLAYVYADPVKVDRVIQGLSEMGRLSDVVGVGIVEGMRLALRKVVTARFDMVPDELGSHIATTDQPTLKALLRQAAVANRVEEL